MPDETNIETKKRRREQERKWATNEVEGEAIYRRICHLAAVSNCGKVSRN